MDANEMLEVINRWRIEFRGLLDCELNDMEAIKKFLESCLKRCGGEFEEQCLVENLTEVFGDYVNDLI